MRTGVECLMDGLKKAGVEIIFGLPGGSVLDIFDKLYQAPFTFVLARHEQAPPTWPTATPGRPGGSAVA